MISLMLVLLAAPAAEASPQAVSATLQSCAMEGGRWVCRYAVPDIEIVPIPGSDIVADAPASVLGDAPSVDGPVGTSPSTALPEPPVVVVDPGLVRPIDAGVLTEREARLVARCADAGWMSLCLPDDRRAARTLRERETAYLAVRRDVTSLLAEDDCSGAVKAALDGGYLALARETREYCAANSDEPAPEAAAAPPPVAAAKPDEPAEED